MFFSLSIELIETNIGNFTKPLFFLLSPAQRKSHKSSGDCNMFIRTECQSVRFVIFQAKWRPKGSGRAKLFSSNLRLFLQWTLQLGVCSTCGCCFLLDSGPSLSSVIFAGGGERHCWRKFFHSPSDSSSLAFDYFGFKILVEMGFSRGFCRRHIHSHRAPQILPSLWLYLLNIEMVGASSSPSCGGRVYFIWIPLCPGFTTCVFHFPFSSIC